MNQDGGKNYESQTFRKTYLLEMSGYQKKWQNHDHLL